MIRNNYDYEFIVLVNRTNTIIDLNGYEIRGYGPAVTGQEYSYYQFTTGDEIQPYSFILVSSTDFQTLLPSTPGILPTFSDFTLIDGANGRWDDKGYIVFRKQPNGSPVRSDYIDVVKYTRFSFVPFTDVPEGSGMTLADDSVDVGSNGQFGLATRGGVSGGSVIYTGYNVASDFTFQLESATTVQNSSSSPLPVELSSFSAVILKNGVKLNWRTETEVANYGFDIQRQTESSSWQKIGFVQGSGNSNSPKEYSFIDENALSGKYSYRLRQIDTDGKIHYSKVINVNLDKPAGFDLSQNYPNPFNPTTTISYTLPKESFVTLKVYNIIGEQVATLVNERNEAGIHTINFDASDLNSGLYVYSIDADGFHETRKMMLLK